MTRCACIDIGSNTTRLLVADAAPGRLAAVVQQRAFTRIGRRMDAIGVIPRAAVDDLVAVVIAQRSAAEAAGAARLRVVATAAIRRAENRDHLIAALRERAGVEVVLLSGDDEARLAFSGATRTLPVTPPGTIAVVDVGGMSTEIAVGTMAAGVTWAHSFAIGSGSPAARCRADPPTEADVARVRAAAAAAFAGAEIPQPDDAVAVGGSAASLPTLVGPVLDAEACERALGVLTSAPARVVADSHGLALERVGLLPAGILVLDAAAQRLGMPLRIGRGGLREGVILELAAGT